jgi:hypothetical protein
MSDVPAVVEVNAVTSGVDYARFGQVLTDAGVDPNKLTALMQTVEQLVAEAARGVAYGVARAVAAELHGVHVTTAMTIHDELVALNPGGGMLNVHGKCVQVARNVAQRRPRNMAR